MFSNMRFGRPGARVGAPGSAPTSFPPAHIMKPSDGIIYIPPKDFFLTWKDVAVDAVNSTNNSYITNNNNDNNNNNNKGHTPTQNNPAYRKPSLPVPPHSPLSLENLCVGAICKSILALYLLKLNCQ